MVSEVNVGRVMMMGKIERGTGRVPWAICSLALVSRSNILSTSSTAAVKRSVVPLARRSSSLRSRGMSGSSRDMVERLDGGLFRGGLRGAALGRYES